MASSDDSVNQSAHAAFIKQVRAQENLYGLTHSQARKQVLQDQQFQQAVAWHALNPAPPPPAGPTVKTTETALAPAKSIFGPPAPMPVPVQNGDGGVLPKHQTLKILVCDMTDPDVPTARLANVFEILPAP